MIQLDDLEGRWLLSRRIEDLRAGLTGAFEGESIWTRDLHGLSQTETGTLTYGSATPMQASRTYLWRTQNSDLVVLFPDERPFHTVPIGGAEAVHDCPPDTYRVRYSFDGKGAFSTVWHVTGARKDAILTTHFTKL